MSEVDRTQPEDTTRGSVPPSPEVERGAHPPIASVLHTVVLVVVLLAVSIGGAHSQQRAAMHGPVRLYAGTIVLEWVLVGYISLGIRRRTSLRELIGGRWQSQRDFVNDASIALAFWFAAIIVLGALGYALGLSNYAAAEAAKRQLGFLVPQNGQQLVLFLGVSVTAGFCEEVIFRGYLQRQFASWTRSSAAGLVLQALVFGASHAYEGPRRMLLIAVYGAMFGGLALWRRSLRPGMIGHALHDGWTGAMLYFFRSSF
jgi:uncharacterized protein